ncbi:MAG TPA: adenylate/guanylate cyclase domain-containing protein [Nocardioidaceae bacterium]|nr:adenylate/guanylate cyclase domain-containing protein [Nocardioidaceae bacterium]
MVSCSSCGTGQVDGARFCHECGSPVAAPGCVSCGEPLPPGAKFCSSCGSSQAADVPGPTSAPAHVHPSAARRVTSVLFGDLVGFTTLSESRDQEDVRELLSRYFEESSRIVGRYGGTVEKFIGDAVMAVWGVPTAHEDDAERAVRSGLELVNEIAALGEDLGVPGLAMRVGIVTGEVAVTIGAEHQGMVAGDAVNTASRVQSAAEPGQVWVDETTRLLTSSAITYLDVGSHPLKGKADPVPLWSVRAVVAAMGGAQRADGLEAPLIGRDRELRLFKELFHATEETGRPALLVVDGEPGVGKSRLSWEFEKYVDGLTSPTRWHSGRCVAYGEGVAFFALAEAIRGRLGALDADTDDDPARLLEASLVRYVPDPEERTWLGPRVGALLGIGSVGTFPREDLFSAWATYLQRVGEGLYPVVLVIDDAQHADEGLLQFVEHLLSVGSFACFVVLLTRPGLLEDHPSLATNRKATVIHLPTLSATDISELLGGLVAGLPDSVRGTLVERSEGVPLFAVETVRSLIDRDLVVPRGGQYVLADPETLDLDAIAAPASLQALIAARLDTLSPRQRRVVNEASVLGASFRKEMLAALCADLADLDEVLAGLVRLQILGLESSRFSAEYGQYQFVQSVVRQVAYATLSRRDRKASHLAVIATFQSTRETTGDLAPIIAQHYLDAIEAVPNDPDVPALKAAVITELRRAATRARALGSPTEAAAHLASALAQAGETETRAGVETELATALNDAGRYAEASAHAVRATEAFDRLGLPVAAGQAAAAHAAALMFGAADNAQALAVAEPRWEALRTRDDAAVALLGLARVLTAARGRLSIDAHDIDEARIKLAEKIGDAGELADAFTSLSVYYSVSGVSSLSSVLLEAAADLARKNHQPLALARCLLNLTVDLSLRDLGKAVATGREAVAVSRATGVSLWISYCEVNLVLALWDQGSWDEAEELVRTSRSEADNINMLLSSALIGWIKAVRGLPWTLPWTAEDRPTSDDPSDLAWLTFVEALHAQAHGEPEPAMRLALEATERMYALSGTWDDFTRLWPTAVDLALEVGDDVVLGRLLQLVDDASNGVAPPSVMVHRKRVAGLVAIRDGGPPDLVEGTMREAISGYADWGSVPYRARAEAELGTWLVGQGRADEAAALLDSARVSFNELGATAWLEQLESPLVH